MVMEGGWIVNLRAQVNFGSACASRTPALRDHDNMATQSWSTALRYRTLLSLSHYTLPRKGIAKRMVSF
jgi:hypothetical protein